ncbi:hypothetical protein [Lysinibacillus sp. FSL P4-0201]|uniref:hypothetical protein n=1 Tax=Lysinibacillus sp. FSL P4-0201 TaxID=2921721 RepID=UPI003159B275
MAIETHENKYLKNCLRCNHEITDLTEDHIYCTRCGSPIRNECTGTLSFIEDINELPEHDFEGEDEFVLEPDAAYCPKCASPSLFNQEQLIEVRYATVEMVKQTGFKISEEDEIPF